MEEAVEDDSPLSEEDKDYYNDIAALHACPTLDKNNPACRCRSRATHPPLPSFPEQTAH